MPTAVLRPPGHHRLGPAGPETPIVLSVPHSGRFYPEALIAASRVDRHVLEALEDRYVDALIGPAVADGAVALVATHARAWIDLNRDEREVDPAMVSPRPRGDGLIGSAKLRGGLGLVPRRIACGGELWRQPIAATDLAQRIATVHRPYHAALADALEQARRRHGYAVLIDCHSMPPLPGNGAQVVIGDRFGRSASPAVADAAVAEARAACMRVTRNEPYAGAHILDRHGSPARRVHAVQVEIDRALYLAPDLRSHGVGIEAAAALLRSVARACAAAASPHGNRVLMAAE